MIFKKTTVELIKLFEPPEKRRLKRFEKILKNEEE